MAESQGDIYVRKDVFDARMDRLEMLLEKTVLEIKTYVDKSTGETRAYVEKAVGELKAEVIKTGNDVQVLTARVDSMENVLYWGLGLFGIILALAALLPSILEAAKRLFKPSVTIEQVKQLIDTAIANHLSGGKTE